MLATIVRPYVLAQGANPVASSPAVATSTGDFAAIAKLIGSGQDAKALDRLATLRSLQPATPTLDRLQGDALYDLNRLPEAAAAYGRALASDPQDGEAAQMRGLTLFRIGRPGEAIPLLEVNHAAGAQNKADPTYVLALCYMDTLHYDEARHAFAAQFGFAADSASAYLLAARMLLRREYLPIAQQYAEKAIALDSHLPLGHELLGEIALAQNRLEVTVSEFEQERAADPLEGMTYERLGDAYSRMGRYADANRVLQQAVLLEPHATGPYILLGKVLLKQNQPVGAMNFLQKAEEMDPANYMTHGLLAHAYQLLGRPGDASRELQLTEKIQAADVPKINTPQ
ncbi:MAG: tetratricopeptide repeat protein [Janthinobacterium lividum]